LHRQHEDKNKTFGFKSLGSSFRSILHSSNKVHRLQAPPGGAQRQAEIVPELSQRSADRAQIRLAERDGSPIDPLELALAPAPGPYRVVGVDGVCPDPSGRSAVARAPVELALVEQLVRRVTWGGDRRRGVARIELDGDLAGTTIWVRGEGRTVALEVSLGPGVGAGGLAERLLGRLRARGLDVTGVEIG